MTQPNKEYIAVPIKKAGQIKKYTKQLSYSKTFEGVWAAPKRRFLINQINALKK